MQNPHLDTQQRTAQKPVSPPVRVDRMWFDNESVRWPLFRIDSDKTNWTCTVAKLREVNDGQARGSLFQCSGHLKVSSGWRCYEVDN